MDRTDAGEHFFDGGQRDALGEAQSRDAQRERVNFTYNGFLGFPISDWILSHLPKKPSSSH